MTTSRRSFLGTGIAAATTLAAPHVARAQQRAANQIPNQIRVEPSSDLRILDPVWTTAGITAQHGAMMYDMLFSYDANLTPQPQMVGQTNVSDDRKTYTFVLRDGLKWQDDTPVTAADCVASIRRWKEKDGAGQHMFQRVTDMSAVDDKTFKIVLREPYGLIFEVLAKTSTPLCFMMKKEIAETDPNTQITRHIGSGPFRFVEAEHRPGSRVVYERNPTYVPRAEPASGMAGSKRPHIDRIIWDIIPDPQTAAAALMSGEIEFLTLPAIDVLGSLAAAPGVKLEVFNTGGSVGVCRLNYLHPPFNDVRARRAAQLAINQEDILRAAIGNSEYYRTCGSMFTCGSPMGVEDGSEIFNAPMPQRLARARELLRESGYDNRPVVVLQTTDILVLNQASLVIAQALRQVGMTVELAASDWGGVTTRRAVRTPPDRGGWNVFFTYGDGNGYANPIVAIVHAANGGNAWFGWPENALNEQLRDEWAAAPTLEQRREVARRLNRNMLDYVHDIKTGQWIQPAAYRSDRLRGLHAMPQIQPWWTAERFA